MVDARPIVGAQKRMPFTVKDATGTLIDAATQVVTVTLPDGTTAAPTVVHDSTGTYHADYTITQAGRHQWTAVTTSPTTADGDVFNAGSQSLGPIVGLTEIRNHLGAGTTVNDPDLMATAERASDAVEAYTGRAWRRQTVVEAYDGGKTALILRSGPILSITSVTESGATVAASGYVIDSVGNLLVRGSTAAPITWIYGIQNVTVTYVVGPPAGIVPDDVIQGTLEEIRHLWDTQRGGSNLPRQQGADTEWDPRAGYSIPRRVAELLDRHRAVGIA